MTTRTEATGRGWKLAMLGLGAVLTLGLVTMSPALVAIGVLGVLVSAIGAWLTSG